MEKELSDISNTLLTIYNNNLEFLKENFEDLFNKVNNLSNKINDGTHKEKYSLEYIDGYFDILNNEDNTWFYATNSYEDADNRAKNSNFTKDGSLDLLRKGHDGESLIGANSFGDVLPILDYMNENIDFTNIEFQKIYKFVFMGVGVGIHMHEINKRLNSLTTLIIEPELEIFRLSLFTIDYMEFQTNNKKLFLSVEDTKNERTRIINEFYIYHNYMNYNIKHHLLIQNYSYLQDELVDFFSTNDVTSFPYKLTLENINKTISFIKEKDRFLNMDTIIEKKILKDKNILVISAGPSLDNYIDWIEDNQNKFTIVCVDVILKKLEKHNIIPDIVVSIDPSYLCAEYLTCENNDFLKNSTIVFLSQQDENVLKVVRGLNYYFAQSIPLVPYLGFLGSVSNVGTYSFMLAVNLGATKLYTIGNDAAFDQKTGSRYSEGSSCVVKEETKILEKENNIVSAFDVIEVEGNLRDTVKSNRTLITFKDSFESIITSLKFHHKFDVYNLSDGAKLDGFEPMAFEQINNIKDSLEIKNNNIKELMDSVSEIVDMPEYKNDIQILNGIISKVKKHKSLRIKSRDHYLSEKLDIMIWFLEKSKNMSSSVFGNIFLLYIELADIYVNFLLNLKQDNVNNIETITTINKLWSDGIINVLKDLKKSISV